jgi:hypothetical protein
MPTLTIGTRAFEVSETMVRREAVRMFRRMSPPRRAARIETAKTRLRRAVEAKGESSPAARRAAAVIVSQGVTEI